MRKKPIDLKNREEGIKGRVGTREGSQCPIAIANELISLPIKSAIGGKEREEAANGGMKGMGWVEITRSYWGDPKLL
jgi:hypothetical protein